MASRLYQVIKIMAPVTKKKKHCKDEARPLTTLQELMEWKEPESNGGVRRLLHPRALPSSQPRTLVCHDMKGGYLDDRFIGGSSNKDAYRFYHWAGVDTFIYFSHNLVTIPPPVWIDAAHLHGVTVLGTFITEWEPGKAVCEALLTSTETVATAVDKLKAIALFYGFEGWLINIENEIPPEKIPLLQHFLRELTAAMRTTDICKEEEEKENETKEDRTGKKKEKISLEKKEANKPGEECSDIHRVLWYDSVTKDGKLDWQNKLNSLNQDFFDACDGIFLNYTWTDDDLDRSKKAAAAMGGSEGGRITDVYVGLDVFGRNFYAGGKYDTWNAMQVVRNHGLSAAIFAQGWTYETQDNFVEAETRVWGSLAPFLYHQGPKHLPLTTSFCQGYGDHFYSKGKVERAGAWHDLSLQQLQPLWSQEGEKDCLSLDIHNAYNGGGCLGITVPSCTTKRLFLCDLGWRETLRLRVAYKWCGPPTILALLCRLSRSQDGASASSSLSRVLEFRCEENKEGEEEKEKESGGDASVTECPLVERHEENGWSVRVFSAQEVPGYKMTEVSIRLGGAADLRLGLFDITNNTQS